MKEQKIHYRDYSAFDNMPDCYKNDYLLKGEDGTLCGYIRRNTTDIEKEVTCKICLRILNKIKQ